MYNISLQTSHSYTTYCPLRSIGFPIHCQYCYSPDSTDQAAAAVVDSTEEAAAADSIEQFAAALAANSTEEAAVAADSTEQFAAVAVAADSTDQAAADSTEQAVVVAAAARNWKLLHCSSQALGMGIQRQRNWW